MENEIERIFEVTHIPNFSEEIKRKNYQSLKLIDI